MQHHTSKPQLEPPIMPPYSAIMQRHNWNDLRVFLALFRAGTVKEAGRSLGVSETTVARRIKALEQQIGASLFLRSATGRHEATDTALQILPLTEAIESSNLEIREVLGRNSNSVTGKVRISSVPFIVNRFLVPNLAPLVQRYPQLTVELVPTSRNLDLSKREADLAIRLARPTSGGRATKAQKLSELPFGAYAPKHFAPGRNDERLGWITYEDASSDLPQAQWLHAVVTQSTENPSSLKVSDVETALEAVAYGLGKTILPRIFADGDNRLRALHIDDSRPLPARDVWLLSHADQNARSSVVAVKDWLLNLPWHSK